MEGAVPNVSKLVRIRLRNIGCVGDEGLTVDLDNIVCLVGKNNAGKSTILRAYELAVGAESYSVTRDCCQWCPEDAPSEVELEVHIPVGIGNVDEKWKRADGDLLIVRSRWQWSKPDYKPVRSTWDPVANDWAGEGKAGGADNVFKSRLPKPLRVGSLQDAESTEKMLLTLALTPLLTMIEAERAEQASALSVALSAVIEQVNTISANHEDHFNAIATKVTAGFKGVFPKLDVRLSIGTSPWAPKIDALVKEGSGLRVKDGKADTTLLQQGTGARRALFWAMLQVHNELTREKESREASKKQISASIKKCKDPEQSAAMEAVLAALEAGGPLPEDADDPAFPGYLLLIDEPENALHPMAARAAQRHLYKLAESADWQVMMTTHSPYFINPLEDHTTIVRLERSSDEEQAPISPKTYRSDTITFDSDTKKRLQALQQIDPSLAEIFFGSYPIIVEGDTEHAAFMASVIERQHELIDQITLIRARGKAILTPLIQIMTHFKINFGVVHDCDPPFTKNATSNGMWTENGKIFNAVRTARDSGVVVRHRVSVPDFERFLGGDEESKDKPLNAYRNVTDDDATNTKVQALLNELLLGEQHDPLPGLTPGAVQDYLDALKASVQTWAGEHGEAENPRYRGPQGDAQAAE